MYRVPWAFLLFIKHGISVSRNLGKFCSAECTLHTIGVEIVPRIVLLCCRIQSRTLHPPDNGIYLKTVGEKVNCKEGIFFS
jgi:hypothetical protein